MRKVIKLTFVLLLVILLILVVFTTWISRKDYQESNHYKLWKENLSVYNFSDSNGAYEIGWALINITPDSAVPLAGYGKRKGVHFTTVHDSIFVRSIAVGAGNKVVYLVSADLLFIPPKVIAAIEPLLRGTGVSVEDIHFSATHSHSSIGGWENTLTGELFGGEYNPAIVEMLAQRFKAAILQSKASMAKGRIFYSEVVDSLDVRYRLKIESGVRDTELRSLTFKKNDGEMAHLLTYSAHNTVLSDKNIMLSRDYAGAVVDSLLPHFGVYMSGAVAGMGPVEVGKTEYDEVINQAHGVIDHFLSREDKELSGGIVSGLIEIPLPEPSARLTKNFGLRPWVFRKFFGDYKAYIKVTKMGNVLMLGMPADFSGEIMVELDAYAKSKGLDLIITSFNGGYIGYVTHDRIYDSGVYETTTMSWYGYQLGGYFTQISKDIIDKLR